MKPLVEVVVKAGLLDENALAEMRRFGAPVEDAKVLEEPPTLSKLSEEIAEIIQREGFVLTRETDLEIVQQYASTARPGTLYIQETLDGPVAEAAVVYGKTPTGGYIFPWRSDSIQEMMTNGLTYLLEGEAQVFFGSMRELVFGDHKAFMVCFTQSLPVLPVLPKVVDDVPQG